MKWIPFELHTHTVHSDGKHSLLELSNSARNLGFEGIALTDHNTMSGLTDREAIKADTGIEIIRGMEWTTFWGHMVALGVKEYVDWRGLGPSDIHKGIRKVHDQGGIVGVAHPFRIGSPMCGGCYWEYTIEDWNKVDYVEVWSGTFPSIRNNNTRAYEMWTYLLNQGYRISATSGRDWHISEEVEEPICATYLGIKNEFGSSLDQAAVHAMKQGAISVSMGPRPILRITHQEKDACYDVGDLISLANKNRQLIVTTGIDPAARDGHWKLPEQSLEIHLITNKGTEAVFQLWENRYETTYHLDATDLMWIRAELMGTIHEVRTMIGFTNPIYLE